MLVYGDGAGPHPPIGNRNLATVPWGAAGDRRTPGVTGPRAPARLMVVSCSSACQGGTKESAKLDVGGGRGVGTRPRYLGGGDDAGPSTSMCRTRQPEGAPVLCTGGNKPAHLLSPFAPPLPPPAPLPHHPPGSLPHTRRAKSTTSSCSAPSLPTALPFAAPVSCCTPRPSQPCRPWGTVRASGKTTA